MSFLHLLLIAWARYVALAKWMMDYRATVTRGYIKKYTRVAGLLVVMAVLTAAMESASVRYEMLVVDVIFSIFWFVCLSFMVAFLAVRKWNRTRIRQKGKTEERDCQKSRFLSFFASQSHGNACYAC